MTNKESFAAFSEILVAACAQIGPEFFALNQANKESKYRERVYAYELYHILRSNLRLRPELKGLVLNGEVDKAGRKDFSDEKPDLLFHSPGSMDSNIAIVEIKTCFGSKIDEAVDNLAKFTTNYGYFGGVLLVFGGQLKKRPITPDRCHLIYHLKAGDHFLIDPV